LAFLMRHLGMLLLPWGLLALWLLRPTNQARSASERHGRRHSLPFILHSSFFIFTLGFLLAASPQLAVNGWQTGNPLYSQQAKNIWLGVYGNSDWERWEEVPDSIGLREVVLRDPARFFANWWGNLRAFVGTGGEDTSEFGRAVQLRLLGWPANWLALLYFGFWILDFGLGNANLKSKTQNLKSYGVLLVFVALYVAVLCLAFVLTRFALPLAPLYALAAAGGCVALATRWRASLGWLPVACLLLVLLLGSGFGVGARYVLGGQPADEVAAARLVLATLQPGERLLLAAPPEVPLGKYSAIAHLVAPWPVGADEPAEYATAVQQAAATGAAGYLLWSDAPGSHGPAPLPAAALVGRAGVYGLYRIR
jgi:hypothetical protein